MGFVRHQLRAVQPMIDFSLFKNPVISTSIVMAMVAMIALVGFELLLSKNYSLCMAIHRLEAGALYFTVYDCDQYWWAFHQCSDEPLRFTSCSDSGHVDVRCMFLWFSHDRFWYTLYSSLGMDGVDG